MRRIPRVGIGGPVGSGKTALIEALVPLLITSGYPPLVITNDIVTREDAEHVRRTLAGVLDPQRVVGVETGCCPHTAVRDDPTLNMAAADELEASYDDARLLLLESGGDKVPRKRGPGLIKADLLVINKIDLAPYVGASLEVMERDARLVRNGRPFLFTNCRTGTGLTEVRDTIEQALLVPSLA